MDKTHPHYKLAEAINGFSHPADPFSPLYTPSDGRLLAGIPAIIGLVLAAQPKAEPAFYETTKRPPTREDANQGGWVLVTCSDNITWTHVMWNLVVRDKWLHWMPMPPAPESAEQLAYKAAYADRFDNPMLPVSATEIGSFNAAWQARGEYEAKQKAAV